MKIVCLVSLLLVGTASAFQNSQSSSQRTGSSSTRTLNNQISTPKPFQPVHNRKPISTSVADSKTQLQELLQHGGNLLPTYTLEKIIGADHDQVFYVDCNIEKNDLKTTGKGSSRRNAEQQAAKDMLNKLNEKGC